MTKVLKLIDNKKTIRKYVVYKTFEAGLVLHSLLVKQILRRHISLDSVHGWIKDNEIFLRNLDKNNSFIKLLLHKEEIKKITKLVNEKQYLLIPTNLYLKNHKIKIELGLVKYNKEFQKDKTTLHKLKEKSLKRFQDFD